ncbi:cytochrome P450 [Aspergillus saccharolyticus JOP 1030-1]|uniref:N-alkane-inducible cytochrome P450 n=1 Tax=Aspergillus saccharolyticus JOP 1030-1 TaxID=1450539 RepID=A0A318ZA59_9EURO|nr:n-alkane-inducible cytochrome P450 [Aspergillus saccharolyticus JOP 1030-1]PYH43214.1 n-alkane-inducible cytochrome P450 [Aspergillus saccharolyticus JOP 1030-1]
MLLTLGPGLGSYLLLCVLGWFVFKKIQQSLSDRAFARKHNCGKAPHLPTYLFGFDTLFELLKSYTQNKSTELVRSWHHRLGRTFTVHFGKGVVVQTCEPKNVQAVLATQFHDFDLGDRKESYRPLLGEGIFAVDGKVWEHSRALLRPNFVRNQISDIAVYERHVLQLFKHIPSDGSTVDLQDLFLRMTLDSATEFLFGHSVDTLGSESLSTTNSFAENFKVSLAGTLVRVLLGPLRVFYRSRAYNKATEESRKYVGQFVRGALEHRAAQKAGHLDQNQSQGYVFLYELVQQTQDEKVLTDQLLSVLLAGRDTTAILLTITFFIMSKREDVWRKLRAEVLNLEGKRPSFEDLKNMKYLTWVMNETLRLYPIVPINIRTANKNTTLPTGGGPDGKAPVFIAKGQEVMYSSYTMHRLPDVYGNDATEYRPERWANLRPGWAYIPFNGGPRICIAQQFALTEAGYTIVRILQEYESIESRDPEPLKARVGLTLASANGAKVALTPVRG